MCSSLTLLPIHEVNRGSLYLSYCLVVNQTGSGFDCVISALCRPTDKSEKFSVLHHEDVLKTNHVNANKLNNSDSENTRPIIHEVLLEPIHHDTNDCSSFRKESLATAMFEHPSTTLEMDTHTSLPSNPTPAAFPQSDHGSASAPVSTVPSRAPSRAASTLPSALFTRNGLVSTPSPILEPNGIAAGTYQRAPVPPPADTQKQVKRRSGLDQVEQWVQVQKAEQKGFVSHENSNYCFTVCKSYGDNHILPYFIFSCQIFFLACRKRTKSLLFSCIHLGVHSV